MRPSELCARIVKRFAASWNRGVPSNPRVFGSVLNGEDTEESDLDLLVDPTPETSIFDIGEIRYQLRTLLGAPVDVLTPKALHVRMRDRVVSESVPV